MFCLLKKKLHKQVTVCVAVPITEEQFSVFLARGSDFCFKLKNSNDWKSYAKTAEVMKKELERMSSRGAKVIQCFDSKSFEQLKESDVVIVFAHHTTHATIELYDGEMAEMDFVKMFPMGFSGVVDLSSCQSKSLIEIAKYHYPKAHFLGVNANTALALKAIIIENVIKLMAKDKGLDYFNAYLEVLEMLDRYKSQYPIPKKEDVVYLGDNRDASVYAPSSVKRGQDFIIQLYIYDLINKDEVNDAAIRADEETVEKSHKKIRIPLSKGDKVQVQLHCQANCIDFQYDKDIQEVEYDGDTMFFDFIVSINDECALDAFVGKVLIAVNDEPAGHLIVKVKIGDKITENGNDYSFTRYNPAKEREKERRIMMEKLQNQLLLLKKTCDESQDETERIRITQMMKVCEVCIKMIIEEPVIMDDKYKTIFVSSTSDMSSFRDIALKQILSCEMHPEMYEYWGQDNAYPCYECCRRVKNSDALVCILGASYGYIEPTIGMSMTEIEYRTAMLYGKNILVYVQNTDPDSAQQRSFIEEVREKRLVHFFETEYNLAESSGRELMSLKYRTK